MNYRALDFEFGYTIRRFKGASGGGGSGKVDYPAYMKTVHNDWLDQTGTDTITASITEIMNTAQATSPFSAATAYDPATPLADAWAAVCALDTLADAMDHETDWTSALAAAISEYDSNLNDETEIVDAVNAFERVLHDALEFQILPEYRAGYRDVNAVHSSAFTIGEAVIRGMGIRDVAKFNADLRLKSIQMRTEWTSRSAEMMLKAQMARVEFERAVASLSVEHKRIHVVATKEETDTQLEIDESDALWDMETFQYGANVLAAIGSGTVSPKSGGKKPSATMSALGGAMSGAAAGSAIMPGWGTLAGAIVGGIGGYLSA